jgi:hypothetical protein
MSHSLDFAVVILMIDRGLRHVPARDGLLTETFSQLHLVYPLFTCADSTVLSAFD